MAGTLNRVVEEVAREQVYKLIGDLELLDQQLIDSSKNAKNFSKSFSMPTLSNNDMNKKLLESQRIIKQLQSDYKKQEDQLNKLSQATTKHTTAVNKLTQEQRNEIINNREIRKELDGNAIATSNLTTYIQKLSVERLKASRTVQDLNAQIALGNELSESQRIELDKATASFKRYDTAIKAGKNSVGDFREDVGNYAKGSSNLSNSIGQISRELPNFGQSFSIGVLSLTNNIGALDDALKQVRAQNLQLQADGKATTSVLTQVLGSLFSWTTLLYISIGVFSAYSKEISAFTKSLFGASEALVNVKEAIDKVNESTSNGIKSALSETQTIKGLIAVTRNQNLSLEDRNIALKNLVSQYPYYFKGLKDETVLNGNVTKSVNELYDAINKSSRADELDKAIITNKERIVDLNNQIAKLEKANPNLPSRSEIVQFADIMISGDEQDYKDFVKEITALNQINSIAQAESNKLRGESIGLLDKENKETKDRVKLIKENTKANEDYLASEYELLHLRLTNIKNANEEIMNDEASSYDLRLQASEQYYNNLVDLANMEAKEELRVLKFSTDDRNRTVKAEYDNQKAQLDSYLKDSKITQDQYNQGLKDATSQMQYDLNGIKKDSYNRELIIFENQAEKLTQANLELIGTLKRAWDEINFGKAEIEIEDATLQNIYELGDALGGITDNMSIEDIQRKLNEINRMSADFANEEKSRNAQLSLDIALQNQKNLESEIRNRAESKNLSDQQIENILINNKAYQDSELEVINAKKQVAEADNQLKKTQIANLQELKEEQRKYNEAVYDGRLELYNSISDLGNQLFENQINRYDQDIEKSNEYYDSLLDNAESGSEQEKLLQEQKEKAEEEIQKRKVAAQRKQAIFNKLLAIADIAINLQATISKNNATLGTILAAPINTLAIISAAVQGATVLAVPLPQYKDGRIGGPEEMAITGDGGVNEIIEKPDGSLFVTPNKPTLTHLGKGDIVHSSFDTFNKSKLDLENASIMASFANQRMQLQAFDLHLSREFSGISEKIEKGIEKGFKKARIINNNNMPKLDLSHYNYKSKGFNA